MSISPCNLATSPSRCASSPCNRKMRARASPSRQSLDKGAGCTSPFACKWPTDASISMSLSASKWLVCSWASSCRSSTTLAVAAVASSVRPGVPSPPWPPWSPSLPPLTPLPPPSAAEDCSSAGCSENGEGGAASGPSTSPPSTASSGLSPLPPLPMLMAVAEGGPSSLVTSMPSCTLTGPRAATGGSAWTGDKCDSVGMDSAALPREGRSGGRSCASGACPSEAGGLAPARRAGSCSAQASQGPAGVASGTAAMTTASSNMCLSGTGGLVW
mmetsp:Transcript_106737/g.271066  ORF Transcript_106737/g.271066 Transcript_106737/m.271066 type:complete len:272 (+) Transcript_106737:103-918(+)